MTEEHWMQRTYISGEVVASGTIAFMLKVPQTAVWRIVGPRKQNHRRRKEAVRLRRSMKEGE